MKEQIQELLRDATVAELLDVIAAAVERLPRRDAVLHITAEQAQLALYGEPAAIRFGDKEWDRVARRYGSLRVEVDGPHYTLEVVRRKVEAA